MDSEVETRNRLDTREDFEPEVNPESRLFNFHTFQQDDKSRNK